jgi:hypothetical protein
VVLVYGGGDTWLLRDYRTHQSTPVPIHLDITYGLGDVETAWLRGSLAITMGSGDQPLQRGTADIARRRALGHTLMALHAGCGCAGGAGTANRLPGLQIKTRGSHESVLRKADPGTAQ